MAEAIAHSPFINILGMTPNEIQSHGENLEIHFSFAEGPFGKMMIASTQKGLCYLGLVNDEIVALEALKGKFHKAIYKNKVEIMHQNAMLLFSQDWSMVHQINLHLKGTPFQMKVWEALLEIPLGKLVTYGEIAKKIGHPKACRAVGTAIGDNPIFYLIPCHRVIQASGAYGNYFWGPAVKAAIIKWESAR